MVNSLEHKSRCPTTVTVRLPLGLYRIFALDARADLMAFLEKALLDRQVSNADGVVKNNLLWLSMAIVTLHAVICI